MAINPEAQYPGKIKPGDANYPYGSARNITVPGDGTGTPWEQALVNDIFGFQQALLNAAALVPTGSPDKVGASQYLEAVEKIVSGLIGAQGAYVFATVADMQAGTTVGGDTVTFAAGETYLAAVLAPFSSYVIADAGDLPVGSQFATELQYNDKFVNALEINSTSLPVALLKNRASANQDRHIHLWGDSHAWGQGAPDWDGFSGLINFSRHSSYPHNKGFNARIEEFLRDKLQITENVYALASNQLTGRVTTPDSRSDVNTDIDNTFPLHLEAGYLTNTTSNLLDISANTFPNFYAPVAQTDTDSYSLTEYREKLSRGLFKNTIMELRPEEIDEFSPEGKDYFVDLVPDPDYPGSGAGFTQVTFGSQNVIVAEYSNTTDVFYIISKTLEFPQWFAAGEKVYLTGYGVVEIVTILANGAIQLRNDNGSEIGAAAAGYIYPGLRIYPRSYIERALLRLEMVRPGRAMYVSVRHQLNGGELRITWTDSISGGAAHRAYVNPQVSYRNSANPWAPKFASGVAGVNLVTPGHNLVTATKATADAFGVVIDTSQITGGVDEEVIYRIDWASKQLGVVYLEALPDAGKTVQTRGVIFDNNKVVNLAEGAHTVGAWLGNQSSNASETRDHVADILNYTPIQPSHVIVQIPFVNEYIKQNSVATFKADLAEFVQRYQNHLNASNNYNSVGVDFMFFTSLRNREIAFEGGASSPITYDDYVQAAREFCTDEGHAFVDCEQRLFDLVGQDRIDYQRLYDDSNHPSDYANEFIFETLKREYLFAMVG